MKKLIYLSAAFAVALATASCDENTTTAGSSLVQDEVAVVIDSAFTLSGQSVLTSDIQSRTTLQLLGRINAKGFGDLSSTVACQYMPSSVIYTEGVTLEDIDSVKLVMGMYKDGFVGDSLVPMGLRIFELTRDLPSPIASDFDPTGYYDPSAPIGELSYSGVIDGADYVYADDSGSLFKCFEVDLPVEIGRRLYTQYKADPDMFSFPEQFTKWFKGLVITNSFGNGRVTRMSSNLINVYYRATLPLDEENDSTYNLVGSYLAVTPEVVTNNNLRYTMSDDLKQLVRDNNALVSGPLGYDVEIKFPAAEIMRKYQEQSNALSVVNTLSLSIPVLEVDNDYGITPPPYILMVKKSKKEEFFASSSQINDNISSFYATYDSSTKKYNFSSMRDYFLDILSRGEVTADDEEFVICPVQVSFYVNSSSSYYSYYYGYNTTSTQVSSITPYVTEPVMGILDLTNAKIKFSFSKQTL